MAYKIVIEIDDQDAKQDDVKSITSYLAGSVERAGLSYIVNCFQDGLKVMTCIRKNET